MANEIKGVSVKKAVINKVITAISKVRVNENGYPFVTVIKGDKASNVYFGKKSAESVAEGMVLSPDQLRNADFVHAVNEADEDRIKLSLSGSGDYTNLAAMFGDDTITAEEKEVLQLLAADMTAVEEEAEQPVANQA